MVAYLAAGGTTTGDYFASTNFTKSGDVWKGGKYWPLSESTLNFLAVTNKSGLVTGKISTVFGEGSPTKDFAKKAIVTLSSNNVFDQADLMYAAGQGKVTKTGNALTYGNNVSLVFQHALAWINFAVKTSTSATGLSIKVNSITLNNAVYNGTYTITNTTGTKGYSGSDYAGGYNVTTTPTAAQWGDLVGVWTPGSATSTMAVPNSTHDAAQSNVTLTSSLQAFGIGLLVVPDSGADGFTINYTITQGDVETTYNYTYTFSSAEKTWSQRKKYTYNINITLTEIQVAPTVQSWSEETATDVSVPSTGA